MLELYAPVEKKQVDIECEDIGEPFCDEGQWRSWSLCAHGSTLEELQEDATIEEIDQDGGELDCYGYHDASNSLQMSCDKLFRRMLGHDK